MELKFNGTYQLVTYADVMNLLGTVMKRNTDTLSDASKNVVIKVN
jgi:hypothetical protein